MSIDAATGSVGFSFPWRSRSYESVNAASPVVIDNRVFVSASYRTGGALLEVLPDGKHRVVWTSREIGTHWNTAVHKDGYLYAFDGRNEPDASLVCIELKTGKVMWRETPEWTDTLVRSGVERKELMSTYRGTLLSVDGHFLALGEMGHLLWLDLSPRGYKQLARAWLFAARETWSAPVLSRGLLYISQHSRDLVRGTPPRLLCYDLRGRK
jgi:outer membrane protein assembly factor BamB